MFFNFKIFNYHEHSTKGLLVKIEPKAHPHAAIRYAAARPSSLFLVNLLQLLLLSLAILQLHELNQKPSSCRVNHHMYELYVVGQKIRLSSTPLKPAEPTPRSA